MKFKFFLFGLLFSGSLIVSAQNEPGVVKIKSDPEISKVLKQRIAYNKDLKLYKAYRIQLFYGSEKAAAKQMDKFRILFPNIPVNIIFSSPDWKVQAGSYHTKLDADRDLKEVKMDFPRAFVLETKIERKK
jgi:hypothetical protein